MCANLEMWNAWPAPIILVAIKRMHVQTVKRRHTISPISTHATRRFVGFMTTLDLQSGKYQSDWKIRIRQSLTPLLGRESLIAPVYHIRIDLKDMNVLCYLRQTRIRVNRGKY